MTIHDKELQQLIGSAVDPATLKQFDANVIATVARRRAKRRKVIIGSVAAAAIAASASAVVFGIPGDQTPVARPTTQPDAPRMRPACPPPQVTIPNVALGEAVTLRSTNVGTSATVEAVVLPSVASRVIKGELVVAKPGSSPGIGDPVGLPADAALRPENQLASGKAVIDIVPNGQKLTVTFQPTAPGSYPVFFVSRYITADDCAGPAPSAGRPIETAGRSMMQLGEIVVK